MHTNPSISEIVAHAKTAQPRLGQTHLTVIDGPAASGKTTASRKIATALGAHLFHIDQMLEGWGGLARLWPRLLDEVLLPIRGGKPGVFRAWDWEQDCLGQWSEVPVTEFLVIEGVGTGHQEVDQYASFKIWVEAPQDLRLERGLERDGSDTAELWEAWIPEEMELHKAHNTRARCDVIIDGTADLLD
jgi:uridine kinase